jgi:tripartite-type tricarboxylate transporter receptor subunit TctC
MRAGVDIVHVPYRGSAPMVPDLIGGQVQAAIDNLPTSIEHIKSRRLKALAVTTVVRSLALPDVPTVGEFLPNFEASAFNGVCAPGNTPAHIVDALNKEINRGLADSKIKGRLAELGGTALGGSPADFSKQVAAETEKWANVIRAANIKLE